MNKINIIKLTLLLVLLNSAALLSQSDFEGIIKIKITHDDEISYLDYFMKEKNLRIEMGENAEAVFIKQEDKSLILMPDEKMYMNLNNSMFKNLPGMKNKYNDEENTDEEFDINKYKTGKVKTILGYECHQWVYKDKQEEDEIEAWVTDELGNFMLMQSPMGGGYSPGWSSSVKNSGFFPILVITRDNSGEETSRFEATEINKRKLNENLFSPPSNFNEMKIPGM